ncbi:mRNA cleavage and polyadenylation factor subunit [Blastocladiella emersonii ATCC 22665]|nr:mRNA cleavage and polyadenylation factor subunit [Blastocladiella emersonii ATCC 22665]
MFAVHRSLVPPSAVTLAVHARFTSALHDELILVRGSSTLQVWRLPEKRPDRDSDDPNDDAPVFFAEWTLHGQVTGIHALPLAAGPTPASTATATRSALVLAIADAKAVVLEYDPTRHVVVTVSMHSFEADPELRSTTLTPVPPALHLEPAARCALMQIYRDHWAVIPFRAPMGGAGGPDAHWDMQGPMSNGHHHKSTNGGSMLPLALDLDHDADSAMDLDGVASDTPPFFPSFVVRTADLSDEIRNVTDVAFVHGYLEPTLAVLHEAASSGPTWAGMLDVRRDTMRLAFLTLDLRGHRHPALFSSPPLPSSSFRVLPLPMPTGGVLVLSPNGLIFVSQQAPSGVGVCVNPFPRGGSTAASAVRESGFAYAFDVSHLGLLLDGCSAFVVPSPVRPFGGDPAPRVILGLRSGDVWACDLVRSGAAGGVRGGIDEFRFTRLFHAAPLAALVPLPSFHLGDAAITARWFLGSPEGPSVLVDVAANDDPAINGRFAPRELPADAPRVKRRKLITAETVAAENAVDAPRLVLPGDTAPGFRVAHALPGLGGIKDAVMTQFNGRNALFCLAGSGAGAHYMMLHQTLRPHVLNRFKVPGARKIWSVRHPRADHHAFLVMSGEQKTMVFRTGHELSQVSNTGFELAARSVFVGTLAPGGSRTVQVLEHAVLLLDTATGARLHRRVVHAGTPPATAIAVASVHAAGDGRFLVTLSRDLSLAVFRLADADDGTPLAALELVYTARGIAFASVFLDSAAALAPAADVYAAQAHLRAVQDEQRRRARAEAATSLLPNADAVPAPATVVEVAEMDELDLDFYGAASSSSAPEPEPAAPMVVDVDAAATTLDAVELPKREYLVVVRAATGLLEIIALAADTPAPVFTTPHAIAQLPTLSDAPGTAPADPLAQRSPAALVQAHVFSVGPRVEDTLLHLVTKDGTLLVYQAHHPDLASGDAGKRAATVWTRVGLDPALLLHTPAPNDVAGAGAVPAAGGPVPPPPWLSLRVFQDVAGHAGVFVIRGGGKASRQCFWIMRGAHGELRAVPMAHPEDATANVYGSSGVAAAAGSAERAQWIVSSFATFHNVNCKRGFTLVTTSGDLVLAQLDPHVDFSLALPSRSKHTGTTAHRVSYDAESGTLAVATSRTEPFELLIEVPDQHEHHPPSGIKVPQLVPDMLDRGVRAGWTAPRIPRFSVQLISVATPGQPFGLADTVEFAACEQVTAVHHVSLECSQSRTGRRNYLAVGTTLVKGEDVAAHGRVYIFEAVAVVPEPGKPATAHRLRRVCVEEVKAPVTSLGSVQGHLAVGQGSKVILYDLDEDDETGARSLLGMAFHHTNVLTSHLVALKGYLLAGDLVQSVQWLVLQADPAKLVSLGADPHPLAVTAMEACARGNQAACLAADDAGAVHMLAYAPHNIQSFGGTKLLRRGDFFLGAVATKMVRYRMLAGADPVANEPALCTLMVTRDGSVALIAPVSETQYKRLLVLSNQLAESIPTVGGLHPKAHRQQPLVQSRLFSNNQATMLDLDVVAAGMLAEPIAEQHAYVKGAGSTLPRVRWDLRALAGAWTVF